MNSSNLIRTQAGELFEIDKLFTVKEKVTPEVPISYNLAARSNLIKKVDGRIVDFVESVIQGREVFVENIPMSYSLLPQSDTILLLNGEKVSFIETIILGTNTISKNRLFKNLVYGTEELSNGYFRENGTVASSPYFKRRFIPVLPSNKYKMKGSSLGSITGFFAYFDSEKNPINSLSQGGRWSSVITSDAGVQYRETEQIIPQGVHYIGMSYNADARHGQNLMVWKIGVDPCPNDYIENICYY